MLRIYEITFENVGHGHCPTKKIAASNVESAIEKAREVVGKSWGNSSVISINTLGVIDEVAD
jgi:hypothetical protein